jgi:CheY-like chemotaxis protein
LADPEYNNPEPQRLGGYRTHLGVPLLRDGSPIGVILVSRRTMRPFDNRQIELVTTFADQAVIAIENTRLFEEVQARNTELRVALEQQSATSELLKVIGRSTFDLQPVFETLAENACRLCQAQCALVFQFDGHLLRFTVGRNVSTEFQDILERNPLTLERNSNGGRAALAFKTEVTKGLQYGFGDEQCLTQVLLNLVGSRHCQRDRRNARRAHLGRVDDRAGLSVPHRAARACRRCSMRKHILVVEDQEDLRTILRDILSASGYTVIETADGAESVSKAASERTDLVLMDIQLPVLDGYNATRQIKALPGLGTIPIIAVSSFAMKGDEEKARASGCDDYVTKPYSPVDLLRLVRRYLREAAQR